MCAAIGYFCLISSPLSTSHCELVALCLILAFQPSQILSDSLTSLVLVAGWADRSPSRLLGCMDRVEVRTFLHLARDWGWPTFWRRSRLMTSELWAWGCPRVWATPWQIIVPRQLLSTLLPRCGTLDPLVLLGCFGDH